MNRNPPPLGPPATPPVPGSGAANPEEATAVPPTPATDTSVKLDALPSSPPPEVLAAMDVAADAYDKLKADGRQLSFQIDAATGRVSIEVRDLGGQVLFAVAPLKALDVASGGSLKYESEASGTATVKRPEKRPTLRLCGWSRCLASPTAARDR